MTELKTLKRKIKNRNDFIMLAGFIVMIVALPESGTQGSFWEIAIAIMGFMATFWGIIEGSIDA